MTLPVAPFWAGQTVRRLMRDLPPVVITWLAITSLTAIIAIFGLALFASHEDAATAAATSSQNIASAVSQDLARNFQLLDAFVQTVRDGVENPEVMSLEPQLRQAALFDHAAMVQSLSRLFVLDASGHTILDSGAIRVRPADFSGQPFFRAHGADKSTGLFISQPFISVLDGEWSIALSRRITSLDGHFAGVAVGTVKISYLEHLFGALDLGPNGSITLVGTDGTIFARHPFDARDLGRRATMPEVRRVLASAEAHGSFEAASLSDGVRRQIFFDQIGTLPLVQFVSRSIDSIFAAWWRRTEMTAGAMLLLCATNLGLIGLLQVELRRRAAAEMELAVLAATDKLTGVANRRGFDERLEAEWRRARHSAQPVTLLLLDIDHFKAFNDVFGHQGGDTALAALGACLRDCLPQPGDLVARYGGEEFAVLLPTVSVSDAFGLAERIRAEVLSKRWPHPKSPSGALSVSIGVATATPGPDNAPFDLVRSADLALYEAKRSGRDRTVLSQIHTMAA